MLKRNTRAFAVLIVLGSLASADDLSQTLLLSERHHDPSGAWFHSRIRLTLNERQKDGTSRQSLVVIDNQDSAFELKTKVNGRQVVISVFHGKPSASLDGRLDFSKDEAETFGLGPERVLRRRDDYSYVWGLPMKLSDPGAIPGPVVPLSRFEGRMLRKVRVRYDPKVGSDVWDVFFDPATNALSGYRSFHDEAKGDGEFVTLSEEINCGAGVRLPKVRTRYANTDRSLLGEDTIASCSIETAPRP